MSSTPRQQKKPKQKALPAAEVQDEDQYDSDEYYEEEEPAQQQMQQAAPQQMQPQYAPGTMLPPRAEGYRPAAIRESRIKDRPAKPLGESSLSIKIELDLEVEVCWACANGCVDE